MGIEEVILPYSLGCILIFYFQNTTHIEEILTIIKTSQQVPVFKFSDEGAEVWNSSHSKLSISQHFFSHRDVKTQGGVLFNVRIANHITYVYTYIYHIHIHIHICTNSRFVLKQA